MKIIISVFNNLYTDQRIEKISETLWKNGYQVELIGCSWDGLPSMERPYPFHRIPIQSKVLKLAYLEFNYKLYSLLLKKVTPNTLLVANDLDTIIPNYLISQKKQLPWVYDSHEIFTEMPSIQGRWTQKIWRAIEKYCVPKTQYMMTANESYAEWYQKTYNLTKPLAIRNLPKKIEDSHLKIIENNPKIILYQGAINPSRGIDKVIRAMEKIDNAELWIAGNGPKLEEYKKLCSQIHLTNKVKFLGKLHPNELREITQKADVGLSIEENNGLSYYYSLPNKISDYIQSRVPVVCSDFPEMRKITNQYSIGEVINNHSPEELAGKIKHVLSLGKAHYYAELQRAANDLCWENETQKLLDFYKKIEKENF